MIRRCNYHTQLIIPRLYPVNSLVQTRWFTQLFRSHEDSLILISNSSQQRRRSAQMDGLLTARCCPTVMLHARYWSKYGGHCTASTSVWAWNLELRVCSTDHMFLRRCLNTEVFDKAAMDKTLHLFFHKTTYKDRRVNNEVLIIRMAEGSLYLKCLDVRFNWKCQVCSATGGANIIQLRPVMLSWPWPALDQRWLPKSFCTEQLKPVIHARLKRCLYPFSHNWQQRYLAIKAN